MADCPHCDGDGWILNTPELGPCVCVTPERVQALRDALGEAREEVTRLTDVEAIQGAEILRQIDELADLEGADEALATARAALAAYLVSIGLPAAPMVGLSPELAALLDALE